MLCRQLEHDSLEQCPSLIHIMHQHPLEGEEHHFQEVLNQEQKSHNNINGSSASETNSISHTICSADEPGTQPVVQPSILSVEGLIKPQIKANYTTTSKVQTCSSGRDRCLPPKKWSYEEDEMLRSLVVVQHEYDWETLGRAAKVTRQEVIKRWQESIYPQLKVKNKIAGALRWSAVEDSILIEAERKLGEDWDFIVGFLPSRSKFSIEGRWRRLTKNPTLFQQFEYNQGRESEVDRQAMSKYQYRKHVIRQIGAKINPQWGSSLSTQPFQP